VGFTKRAVAIGAGTLSAAVGLLLGQVKLARRTIGVTDERPPSADGVYGDDLPGQPIRCLILGDSGAVGYGMTSAETTPPGLIGLSLSHLLDAPVHIHSEAVVGARTSALREQINRGLTYSPDVAVIIIGTNDVTHHVPPRTSARLLQTAVRRLVDSGCQVVVGTVPDLGTIRPLPQPLKWVARSRGRALAQQQTVAVVSAGGRAVSLGHLLGPVFDSEFDVMFGADRFHPSATGYARIVAALVPSIAASVRQPEVPDSTGSWAGTVMQLDAAAAEAARHVGTEVRREGRLAIVQRRRQPKLREFSRSRAR
jgi:lysophospholipase L1-like esterase